jgi:hypothetical protein
MGKQRPKIKGAIRVNGQTIQLMEKGKRHEQASKRNGFAKRPDDFGHVFAATSAKRRGEAAD